VQPFVNAVSGGRIDVRKRPFVSLFVCSKGWASPSRVKAIATFYSGVPASILVGSADVTAKLQEIEWSWDLVARPVYEHIRALCTRLFSMGE